MNDEQWEVTLDRIEQKFRIEERKREERGEGEGVVEWVVFMTPQGKVRLERTTKPRVVGEHSERSKRIGSTAVIKKIYDPDDLVSYMRAYLWDEGTSSWGEIKGEGFSANF
ncbi:MAG: hypothetical protein WC659_00355 [Patescibacteria group bacterium]